MKDFAGKKNPATGKLSVRLVNQVQSVFHAVTKTKLFRELKSKSTNFQGAGLAANPVNQFAVIIDDQGWTHFGLKTKPTPDNHWRRVLYHHGQLPSEIHRQRPSGPEPGV